MAPNTQGKTCIRLRNDNMQIFYYVPDNTHLFLPAKVEEIHSNYFTDPLCVSSSWRS